MKTDNALIKKRFKSLAPFLNERTRRLYAAAEVAAILRGGIAQVSRATGISRSTIAAGLKELDHPEA